MSLNAFQPRCCYANSQFYADRLLRLQVCAVFDREINVAAQGMTKDADSFSLYDNANKDEGKVTTSDMLMSKMLADATLCFTVCLYCMSF